jgi:hypothetical protein
MGSSAFLEALAPLTPSPIYVIITDTPRGVLENRKVLRTLVNEYDRQ